MAEHSRMMNFHTSILQVASIIKNKEQIKVESLECEKKKRERRANYTQKETDRLIELTIPKRDIIENKKGGAEQWEEKKQVWKEIEKAFNKRGDTTNYRDSKTLRVKYESIRKDVKKKWNTIMAGNKDSYGKLPKLSAAEKKMAEILQLPLEEGFCDFSAINDNNNDDDDSDDSDASDKKANEKTRSFDEDDDESNGSNDDNEEFQSSNVKEPPNKKICRDPLTDKSVSDEKKSIDKKIEIEKLETIKMKKELISKEIQEKELKIKKIQEEMEQSKLIFELQKKRLLMEIEILEKGGPVIEDNFIYF